MMEETSLLSDIVKQEPLWEDSGGNEKSRQVYNASYKIKKEVRMVVIPENVVIETSKNSLMWLKEEPKWVVLDSSSVNEAFHSSLDRHIKSEPDLDDVNENTKCEVATYNCQGVKEELEYIASTRFSDTVDIKNDNVDALQMTIKPAKKVEFSEVVDTGQIKEEFENGYQDYQVKNEDVKRELVDGAEEIQQTDIAFELQGVPESEPGRQVARPSKGTEARLCSFYASTDDPIAPTTPDKDQTTSDHQDSLLVVHKPKRDTHACDLCNKEFNKKAKLTRHKKTHTGEKPYACGKCDKRFTRPNHLRDHDRSHTGDMPYSCDLCGKKFSQSRLLKSHKLAHSGVKPFSCDVCKKGFTQFGHLMTHKRLHKEEKYTCDICKREFAQLVYLKEHLRIHSDVKQYRCNVCTKQFTHLGGLRRHKLVHTKAKPYECVTCKKAFKQTSHLKRHQLVHTKVKQFCCDICMKCFTQKSTLGKHVLLHSNASNAGDDTKNLRV